VLARRLTMYAHSFIVRTMTSEKNQPSDNADIVREALCDLLEQSNATMSETRSALAALDALEAERDVANASVKSSGEFWLERVKAAEAERDMWVAKTAYRERRLQAAEVERDRLREAIAFTISS